MRFTFPRRFALLVPLAGFLLGGSIASAESKPAEAKPAEAKPAEAKLAELTPAQVKQRLGETNFFVYDNNSKDSYAEGHVPKAKWLDYSKVTAADLPADKTATLVFYCANEH